MCLRALLHLSINLSGPTLSDPTFLDWLGRADRQQRRFALDDFGTGLSSLAHLKALHFSVLKIDGSFIRDILHNERSDSLVRVVTQLSHSMGMETVAEYVETPEICTEPDLQLANAS
jgi:EAL domain-containing protein (putative c-di-GMP-specific phosphodiesterase class I)